jgi:carboxypeptidase T
VIAVELPSRAVIAAMALVVAGWPARADWFAQYRDLDEITAHMGELAAARPDLATASTLGTSIEGRPIRALAIGHGPAIVVDAGQHAREWISVMAATCVADRLVTGYDRDPRIRHILDTTTIIVVPIVNPDGYHYTWTVDRAWRKNRRGGYGVDLNRNYPIGWGEADSSDDPNASTYRGERPFSEPETEAMRTLFQRERVVAHVDFHAFSQVIVYPWSHQRADPPDRDVFAAIADDMRTAMTAAHGQRYTVRPGSELRVGAGGTAADWSYATYGALAFLVELRPASRDDGGFELPPEQIVPACDEALAGVLAVGDWIAANSAASRRPAE